MSAAGEVRAQYEAQPYPPRDPADEAKRLVRTWLDDLPMISHYCFGGRDIAQRGFRALVAGGGTGDATIFLAEQLRGVGAEVVHLDFSGASLAVAKSRAAARKLQNIAWVEASLLELPRLALGAFDYVNCVGVLHHLDDPDEGLRALLSALKPEGALGLMLYARTGRTAVYQIQELMRLVCGEAGLAERIAATREVLAAAPRTNWLKRSEDLHRDHVEHGDAGLADLFLHPQDRAYGVEEIYRWLADGHGLHLQFTEVGRGASRYVPAIVAGPQRPAFLAAIEAMPPRRRQAIAELLDGSITMHCFYATRSADAPARYGDPECVPFFFHEPVTGADLAALVERNRGRPFVLDHRHTGMRVTVDPGPHAAAILRRIDGRRTFAEIFEDLDAPREALFEGFRPLYEALRAVDRILLRKNERYLPDG